MGNVPNVDLVSQEGVPVDLLLVKLEKGPVACKLVGPVGDDDGLGVEDEADDVLVGSIQRLVTSS